MCLNEFCVQLLTGPNMPVRIYIGFIVDVLLAEIT